MSKITDHFYISGLDEAHDLRWLKHHHITHIVNCVRGLKNPYPQHFRYISLNLDDVPNQIIYQALEPSYEFIRDALSNGGTVLVHCHAGVSRSASIIIYFLMKVKGWSYATALSYLRTYRPIVNPNPGFVRQLISVSPQVSQIKMNER